MSKLLGDRLRVLSDAVEVCDGGNQLEILLSSETGSMDQSHRPRDFPNWDGYQSQSLTVVGHQITVAITVVFINCVLCNEICQ
jgi:hypothetical protein